MVIAYFDPKVARGSDRGRCLRARFGYMGEVCTLVLFIYISRAEAMASAASVLPMALVKVPESQDQLLNSELHVLIHSILLIIAGYKCDRICTNQPSTKFFENEITVSLNSPVFADYSGMLTFAVALTNEPL